MLNPGGGVGGIDKGANTCDAEKTSDASTEKAKEAFDQSLDEANTETADDTDACGEPANTDTPAVDNDDGGSNGGDDLDQGDDDMASGTLAAASVDAISAARTTPDDEPSPEVQAAIDDTLENASQINQYDDVARKVDHYLETLPPEDRDDYMEGLIEEAGDNNIVAAGIARACENGNGEQVGDIVEGLYDSGRIDAGQVANLVDPVLASRIPGLESVSVAARDMLIGTGNAELIGDVAMELLDRAPAFQDRIDDLGMYTNPYHSHYQTYETIVSLADAAFQLGDGRAAEAIFNTAWEDPDLRADMVTTLAEYDDKSGLQGLLELMNAVDGAGNPSMKDPTETVFQEVLEAADHFAGNGAILGELGIYFDNNVERLVAEAALPQVDAAYLHDPNRDILATNEVDDNALISLFVDRVLLDPAYAGRADSIAAIGDLNATLFERVENAQLSEGERMMAATMLGTIVGSFEKGASDYLGRNADNLAGVAGFVKDLSDWGMEFFKLKKLPIVGGYIKQIRDMTLEQVQSMLNQNPQEFVRSFIGEFSDSMRGFRALLPGDGDLQLVLLLDQSFNNGRLSALDIQAPNS